jgi:hypothetical protein
MNKEIWVNVTESYQEQNREERWLRQVNDNCFVSVLYRLTGFGYREWETAIVIIRPIKDLGEGKERDLLMIAGDRRSELETMDQQELVDWYYQNIEGNKNSFDTLIDNLSDKIKSK